MDEGKQVVLWPASDICSLKAINTLRKYLKILLSKKSLKPEASASGSMVAVCICRCYFLADFHCNFQVSQSYPHLAASSLIISELCVKGESLLHFLNKHSSPPNSTYKCFYYCTLRSMASYLDKDHATTKKNGITTPEPHMPGPCFG